MALGQTHSNPPAKKRNHRSPDTELEFKNVYEHLKKVDLGPFSFIYDPEERRLHLQVFDDSTGKHHSVLRIDVDGTLDTLGAQTGSVTLDNPGRG